MANKTHTDSSEGRKKPSVIKIILFILLGLFILGLLAPNDNQPEAIDPTFSRETSEEENAPLTYTNVDINKFLNEYDNNEVSAGKKYEGTHIKTEGYVDDVSEDILGSVYIIVSPTADRLYVGTSIQCFVEDEDSVDRLSVGDKVTVQGKVRSKGIFNIEFSDCTAL